MAKYRITSIPQYAPGGETNWPPDWMKRKKKKPFVDQGAPGVIDDIITFSKNPVTGEQMYPQATTPEPLVINQPGEEFPLPGDELSQEEKWARQEATYPFVTQEDVDFSQKMAIWTAQKEARDKIAYDKYKEEWNKKEAERVKQENIAWQNNVKNYYGKYKEANTKNLKTKYIKPEPIFTVSESEFLPEHEEEAKKAYYINKNKETGKIEFYPRDIIDNRIMHNGFQISDFVGWGFDKKQITAEWKPRIDQAAKIFSSTMTNKIVTRALEQGKTVDEVISALPMKLGVQAGLKGDFKKPTQKIVTDLFASIQKEIANTLPSTNQTMIDNDDQIFRSSYNPIADWTNKYHKNDINWQFSQINKQQNAFDLFDKERAEKNAKIKAAKDKPDVDLFGNIIYRDPFAYGDTNNEVRQENILRSDALSRHLELGNRKAVGEKAKNEDFMTALSLYKQNYQADILKSIMDDELNKIKGDPKKEIEFLKSFTKDADETILKLVDTEDAKDRLENYWSALDYGRDKQYIGSPSHTSQDVYDINNDTWAKTWDVLSNPIAALNYLGDERVGMWDKHSNMTYTERENIKDKTGQNMGTVDYDSPLGVFHWLFNDLNPIKAGMEVKKGYNEGNFWGALGTTLLDAGMSYGPIKGVNALSKLTKAVRAANTLKYAPKFLPNIRKGTGAFLQGYNNFPMNAGFAIKAPQNFRDSYSNFNQGNYGTATWDALMATAGILPPIMAGTNLLRFGQTPTKAFNLGVTTPKGKYYGFKQMPMRDLSYTTSNEALASELGLNTKKDINALYKQFHPDAGIYSGQVGSNASANLGNLTLVPNRTSMVPGFNRAYPINIHSGKVGFVEEPTFISKNNYRFNFGQNEFKPLTAEEILLRPSPETYQFNPIVKPNPSSDIQFNPKFKFDTPLLGYKKGGSLPKAWNGLEVIKNAANLINDFRVPIQTLKNFNAPIYTNLANMGMNSFFKGVDPATMELIANLKNKKLISSSLPEGPLVTYPNLLNLAAKKGIQDALTFSRSTAGTDFGISSSGTKTLLAPGDLKSYEQFKLENDQVGKALYAATHVPFMRYGQRTGLTNLPYKTEETRIYKFGEGETDYVVADTIEEAQQAYLNQFGQNIDPSKLTKDYLQQGTPDSFDALYTYANNTGVPRSVKKGIFGDQYGKFTSILRYPFDYSGSANDMLSRFTDLERSTFSNAENLSRTAGREFPLPGSIGAFNFTDKPTLQNSFLAPIFSFPETPVIGRPGQKLFDPIATYHKPELEEIDKEVNFVNTLYNDKKYDELINFLNDKIKAGQFGSIESNIQSIKDKPELSTFKFDALPGNKMADKLYMNDIINPETGLIDTGLSGTELEKLSNLAWQSYNGYMHFGPRTNAYYKTDNVEKIPYSPFRFKFKKGGSLPKAWDGLQIARTAKAISNFIKPIPEWKTSLNSLLSLEGALPSMQPIMQKVSKIDPERILDYYKGVNQIPMSDLQNLSNTTGGNSLIQYGNEPFQGESLYHAEPTDYMGSEPGLPGALSIEEWKKQANIDAYANLKKAMENNPPYGKDLFKGVGDFNFAAGSDGWEVRNDLSNLATFGIEPSGPQWVPGKEDFFTLNEISNLTKKQTKHLNNWNTFNKMYPENPSESIFRRLMGDTSRDELFSNLFPNSGIQNFKQKFYRPEHIDLMKQTKPDASGNTLYDLLINNTNFSDQGMLNPQSLKTINTGFETLPKTYQQLLESQKGNDFLQTGPAKLVVGEMRGGLGLSLEEVLNASPEQLEKWRRQIVIKMGKQDLERWKSDISKPFTVQDAWKEISKIPGYKNKNGGIVTKLSKKEIDEYVKKGYVIEEE